MCEGWSFSGPDTEGFYLLSGQDSIPFGNFGVLWKISFSDINEPGLSVPFTLDNTIYPNEKSFTHPHFMILGLTPPDSARTPQGPTTGVTQTAYSYYTSAAHPDQKHVQYRFAWGDGDTSLWTPEVPSGSRDSASHAWAAPGHYAVRAQAKDVDGAHSAWSSALDVAIEVNDPPAITEAPTGPDSGLVGRDYVFGAQAMDPEQDSIRFQFVWGDGDTGSWSPLVASGDTYTESHHWSSLGRYEVRARAQDVHAHTSAWSAAHEFRTVEGNWHVVLAEIFEGTFPAEGWVVTGAPTWGKETYRHRGGSAAAWCVGSSVTPPGSYPDNADARAIYGPFSLADADSAHLTFYRWLQSERNYDYLYWGASTDGSTFFGYRLSGYYLSWSLDSLDLGNVPGLGNLCGQPQVWVEFRFTSDGSNTEEGAWIDDILITKHSGGGRR